LHVARFFVILKKVKGTLGMIKKSSFWLYTLIDLNLLAGIYALFVSFFLLYDDIEHLRAAYFVSLGYVPYRDFFEHHHPLIWYVLAPLMNFIPHVTSTAVYIGRAISYVVSIGTGYFIYKIIQKISGDKQTALIGICLCFWAVFTWPAMFNVKPDIYMRFCFYGGLYYLLQYFYEQKFKYLQISFILFTIGFLFLQTIVMLGAPLVVPIAYYIYKHPAKYKDFLLASVAPLLIIVTCAGILYYNDLLQYYFECNWIYNTKLGKVMNSSWMGNYKHLLRVILFISEFLLLAIVGIILFAPKKCRDIGFLAVVFLFVGEFTQRIFFTTVHQHYLINLVILSVIIAAPVVKLLWQKNNIFYYMFFAISWLHLMINIFVPNRINDKFRPHLYLEKHSPHADNVFGLVGGAFGRYYGYYWMYPNMEIIDNIVFKRLPQYNVNELIQREKFDFIADRAYAGNPLKVLEKIFDVNDWERQIFYNRMVDPAQLDDYEEIAPDFYRRKQNTQE